MRRRIEIFAFPDVQVLDITGPMQVFASANDQCRQANLSEPYELATIAEQSPITTSAGLALAAERIPASAGPVDTVIVPGGFGIDRACQDSDLVASVKARADKARRIASVCSGAFLLATAGFLDGRRAATHWQRCEEFRQRFPRVRLEADPIYVRDGELWTSAGVTAGIDMALAMLQEDLGRDLALAVARQLVVFLKRPGGQSQFSSGLALQEKSDRFDNLHAWILQNLTRTITLNDLAAEAGMSPRTLSRRYKEETGRTPMRALEDLRLERARHFMDQGAQVASAARNSGFGTEETMRQAFHRRYGVSPQAYRERFSGDAAKR